MFREFARDERGMALILVSIMLPVIVGFALLALDMSRIGSLHNDLQKGSDSLAIAAAAELDGSVDSITRADRAIATLVDNQHSFSNAGPSQTLTAAGIARRYLRSIPPTDNIPIRAIDVIADEVADAKQARFVEVTANPVGFSAIFPASFLSGNVADNTRLVGAAAVGGFTSGVCDYTPVFICNPYEQMERDGITNLEAAASSRDWRRKQILMRMDGFYGPGNFAFLESPDGNGAQALEDMLASTKPLACYSEDGVTTEPGQNAGPVEDGLNSRFGIAKEYIGTTTGPAANVRMGLKSIDCNNGQVEFETDATKGVGLNRDSCHAAGTACPFMGGRMGAGDWDPLQYWQVNHPPDTVLPTGLTASSTRYEVYDYENKNGRINDASVSGETGGPSCGQTPVTTVDRRILYGAIIDCLSYEENIGKFSGRREDVPVRAFGSFFITEPIKVSKDIFVELVDITGRGGRGTLDNFLRDEAQLYR